MYMQQTPKLEAQLPDAAPPRSEHSRDVWQTPFIGFAPVVVHSLLGKVTTENRENIPKVLSSGFGKSCLGTYFNYVKSCHPGRCFEKWPFHFPVVILIVGWERGKPARLPGSTSAISATGYISYWLFATYEILDLNIF